MPLVDHSGKFPAVDDKFSEESLARLQPSWAEATLVQCWLMIIDMRARLGKSIKSKGDEGLNTA